MRIAVLADIHGNRAALEAALAWLEREGVTRIVVAGDVVVGAPDSRDCWERVRALGAPVLRGNHERYVFDFDTPRAGAEWRTERFGPVRWAAAQFDAAARAALAALPLTVRLPEAPDVLFVHGSPRSDADLVFPYTPAAEVEAMFAGVGEALIVRAHNHYCGVREWRGGRIVTAGSVGLALDGNPTAQFVVLEGGPGRWTVTHQSVPYDVAATVRRFRESGYREAAGPMARLFEREVETAAFHVVPFLERSRREPEWAALPLAEAVDRFLRE